MALDAQGWFLTVLPDSPPGDGSGSGSGGLSGSGAPSNDIGGDGDTYVDEDSGDLYIRYGGTWHIVQGAPGGSGEAGVGSPEGATTAPPGTTYLDLSTNGFWVKASGVGNTGWSPIVT